MLAVLLLHANETLSADQLLDELWGERPPASAAKTVQVHVSRLRKALADPGGGAGPIVTRDRGYRLELEPHALDARRFERLLADARGALEAGDPRDAVTALERARGLWRGPPLADLAYEPFAQGEIARLADLRVAARELEIDARLALGEHDEIVGELEALIAEHPYRERLRGQLMLALYRSERQAEALQAYQDARRALVEELGIEPGERLRELERAVLAQDPALALPAALPPAPPPAAPAAPAAPRRAARRLVSVLVAEPVPGAALDPEALHALLDDAAETCGAVMERHGGSVEGYAGDAVLGVFGLVELHEDDALRAVRAALELRDELPVRIGVEAGEVFVGGGGKRPSFATGDAPAAATALQGAAAEGEIVLGERVLALLGAAVAVEEPQVAVRGRSGPVAGRRLTGLAIDVAAPATPFVGREAELEGLLAAFAQARDERTCHAAIVLGEAGTGKSRIVRELANRIDATIAVGRCLSYGEAVTFRPLAEIVGGLAGRDPRARVMDLLGDEQAAHVVLVATGFDEGQVQADETFWAVRRLLERVAVERPLVVVVEDVHWAQPMLLDLLEYLTAFSTGHAILLICLARPEFVELRPGWLTPKAGRTVVSLDPLAEADARALVDAMRPGLAAAELARIVDRAEGNPLFLEQLVEVGAGAGPLPSTVQAVLAARIDRLAPEERDVLERAAVEGVSFHVEGGRTGAALLSLVRQGLVRAERSTLPGRDAFRFTHALIRDAAYHGLPKQRRAELHEEAAVRLGAEDELAGHHLAEAHRNLTELGRTGERERALAQAAAARLEAAASAALLRGDPPAGARLLERAAALLPAGDPARGALLPRLGSALLGAGRLADADRVLTDAIEGAPDDPWLQARASTERGLVRMQWGSGAPAQDASAIAAAALAVLEAHGDELGQCRALCLRALQRWVEGRSAAADGDWRRAAERARSAGDEAALLDILGWRASAAAFGSTPVPVAIRRCRDIVEELAGSAVAVARTFQPLAVLHAMGGEPGEALRLVRAADEVLAEVGGLQAVVPQEAALAELLAGRPAEAEARLRRGYEQLDEMGEKALLAGTAAMLAQLLFDRGEHDGADELARVGEETAAEDDIAAQIGWRGVRAQLLGEADRAREGVAVAQAAVDLARRTDLLTFHAGALSVLGAVLQQVGEEEAATAAVQDAIALYRRKGDVVSLARLDDHERRTEGDHDQVRSRQA
jgi:DNA-binding SARP family transcriptional activator